MSALIDSISVQSEPLLTDPGRCSSVAMTTAVEEQAMVIRNYDAHNASSESVDQVETTDTLTNKRPLVLAEEGAEQDTIAMETIVLENRDTMSCDSVPGAPLNAKAIPKEATSSCSIISPLDSSEAKERNWDLKPKSEAESDAGMCTATVMENCDAGNIVASSEPTTQQGGPRDLEFKEGT